MHVSPAAKKVCCAIRNDLLRSLNDSAKRSPEQADSVEPELVDHLACPPAVIIS